MDLFGYFKVINNKRGQAFTILMMLSSILLISQHCTHTLLAAENRLATVYHVYVDDVYVGKVDDEAVVDEIVNKKLNVKSSESTKLAIDENITYVTEKVFNPIFHNNQVAKRLDLMLTVKAEAYELKIGDKVLGYFSDETEANEVITKYQRSFVKEEEFEEFQMQREQSSNTFKEFIEIDEVNGQIKTKTPATNLEIGESKLVDIGLAAAIEITKQRIAPEEIIDVKEGYTLIQKGTLEDEKHTVAKGDVLGTIASKYDLTTKELLELNPSISEDTLLQIDQKLNVTAFKPFVDVITIEEEMVEEKVAYETEIIESDQVLKGEQKVTQKGKNGKKQVHYKVTKTNNTVTDRETLDEQVIKEPTNKVVVKGTKVIPSRGSGTLTWPTNGGYVSSNYGYRWGRLHKGIDIARPSNRTIKAADHGVVVSAGYKGGFGNRIIINHNNGMKTLYAHLSSIDVHVGQKVEKGSQIGIMGSTGNSTGVHLHFEVHQNGAVQNPMRYY